MKVGRFEEVVTPELWEDYDEVWFYHNPDMEVVDFAGSPEDAPKWSGAIVLVDGNRVTKLGYDWRDAVLELAGMLDTEEELKKAAEKLLEVLEE